MADTSPSGLQPASPASSVSPVSPTSPASPASPSPDQSGQAGYFPLSSSNLKLSSIPEHVKETDRANESLESRSGSISFVVTPKKVKVSGGMPKTRKHPRRRSSPPAADRFQHHISFDNFAGGEPTDNNTLSLTLNSKHTGYQYKKRSRTFMVGIDENDYSNYALKWMLDELVDDGDEIVCVRVVDKDAKISSDKSMEKKRYQDEAKVLMESIQAKNDEHRAISIVLEFAVGKLQKTFEKMIQLYEPAMLIVGTRGRSLGGFQGLVANRNSFSKWCLQYSPIPVVVVRPDEKREKKRLKRAADPARNNYKQILQVSGQVTHEADAGPDGASIGIRTLPPNSPDIEAHAVAAALGLPAHFDSTFRLSNSESGNALRRIQSGRSDVTSTSGDAGSPLSRPSSPGLLLRTPKDMFLGSPAISDEGEEDSEEDEDEEFEAIPGHQLLDDGPDAEERRERLHQMEVGEAAAFAGRKGSVGSVGSVESTHSASRANEGTRTIPAAPRSSGVVTSRPVPSKSSAAGVSRSTAAPAANTGVNAVPANQDEQAAAALVGAIGLLAML